MNILKLASLPLLLWICAGFSTLSEENIFYVESEEISTSSYKELYLAAMENDLISIEEACVPAHVLKIRCTVNEGTASEYIKNFCSEEAGMVDVTILENYNYEDFMEKCSAARIGR